ncbi:hypothetical protein Ddc_11065 [Ditylenchus destructor]|nr:hypothetical protein Ddc_11065 [Ditylenchus destructor]
MVSGANHLPDDIPQYSITLPTEVLTDIFQFFPAIEAVNAMLVTRCFSKLSTPATRYLQELILDNRRLKKIINRGIGLMIACFFAGIFFGVLVVPLLK